MKYAIIGGNGHHSLVHLALADPEFRLVAVASDGRDNRAAEYQDTPIFTKDSQYFDDYEKMLDVVKPNVVSVGCQYAFNGRANRAVLERGIPVLSEKPIANSMEELTALDKLVRGGARLVPEFTMRWNAEYIAARRAVAEGRIGKITLVGAQKSYRFNTRPDFYKKRETYTGTISWVAVHAIDFARWCAGFEYASVSGVHGNFSQPDYPEFEDHVTLNFALKDGGACVITADFLRPKSASTHSDDRLRVMGTKGYVEVRNGECVVCTHDGPEEKMALTSVPREQMARDMLASALGEKDSIPWDDTFRITEVCLKARDAADSGRPVAL
jgi:predicted dehydrogenase